MSDAMVCPCRHQWGSLRRLGLHYAFSLEKPNGVRKSKHIPQHTTEENTIFCKLFVYLFGCFVYCLIWLAVSNCGMTMSTYFHFSTAKWQLRQSVITGAPGQHISLHRPGCSPHGRDHRLAPLLSRLTHRVKKRSYYLAHICTWTPNKACDTNKKHLPIISHCPYPLPTRMRFSCLALRSVTMRPCIHVDAS